MILGVSINKLSFRNINFSYSSLQLLDFVIFNSHKFIYKFLLPYPFCKHFILLKHKVDLKYVDKINPNLL